MSEEYESIRRGVYDQQKTEIADLRARLEKAEKDAERYAYILNCDYLSAKQYVPGLNEEGFKAQRTQAHDAAIAKERAS